MKILAIETSCDDTSIAIFEDDKLLAMDTKSQIKIHNITWWVVPEVAAREHANAIFEVLENVLIASNTTIEEIEYIWVTAFPWLLPSLLTWLTVARTIWKVLWIKVIELNHIEGHIFSNFLERKKEDIKFPLVCLTVSGWHNDIYYMKNMWSLERIWTTWDDAAWESYDKVAKMMWLWYPGWPIISEYSSLYNLHVLTDIPRISKGELKGDLFPRVWLDKDKLDFSFSWLKSAVKREIDKRKLERWDLSENDKQEISFEFQNAVNEVLAWKLIKAWIQKWVKTVMLAWWVSANDNLREKISVLVKKENMEFIYPTKKLYSMDNAAMIWILAYYRIKELKI